MFGFAIEDKLAHSTFSWNSLVLESFGVVGGLSVNVLPQLGLS